MPTADRFPPGIGPVAGLLGGAVVGLADGVRAGVAFGLDAAGIAATAALCAGLDALAGALVGALVEPEVRLCRWGRRVSAPPWTRVVAAVLASAGAAGAAAGAVAATALRNNRFLAGGLAALAAAGATAIGIALGPAVARILAGRRASPSPPGTPQPAAILLAPAAVAVLGAAVLAVAWKVRPPLRGSVLHGRAIAAAAIAASMPIAAARAARIRLAVPWKTALLGAAGAYALAGAAALGARWESDLRFAPWADLLAGTAIAAAGVAAALRLGPRLPRTRLGRAALPIAGGLGVFGLVLAAGSAEAARKAAGARAGLAAPILAAARAAFDRDRDGYSRLLGGGDCDDGDSGVHPGAQDWPDDGIDQDCDGKDASVAILRSPLLPPVPDAVPRDPSILFVTIDTLRADHLGCYGYGRPTSPELDRLAAEGTLFENGWAHAPSTRYSMPAIATGRWPSAIEWESEFCEGCSIWWPRISRRMPMIGEKMKAAGYATGALYDYTYFSIADRRGFERGIDDYQDRRAVLHQSVTGGPEESRGSSSREMADDAIAFIDAHKGGKFFLWVHFYDPHLVYEKHPDVPDFGSDRPAIYDNEIRFTDMHVGRIFARLRDLGLWDRTAVIVTGDHGEGFGEHGVTAHGFDLYGPQTKVPFIVRVPGLPPRRDRTPVGHVDIAPTMLNLARGAHEPSFLGRSLVPLAAGAPAASRDFLPVFQEVSSERGKKRALVDETHHLVWNWEPENTTECYDLGADPAETRDLWGRSPPVPACARLGAALKDRVAALALPPGFAEKLAFGVVDRGVPMPSPQHAAPAQIGEAVKVIGWDGPDTAPRGGEIEVVVYYEVLKRVPPGWRLFFHVEGPGGNRNLDHAPVEGAYPIERWKPGQRIRDRVRIAFPDGARPGPYRMVLGLWRGGERMPVTPPDRTDGQSRVWLGTVTVP